MEKFRSFRAVPVGGLIATLLLSMMVVGAGAAGQLDESFGEGGRVLNDWGPGSEINDVAVQPDGKLVAVGRVFGPGLGDTADFGVARYQQDGALDTSFGNGGLVRKNFRRDNRDGSEAANAVRLQPDGKIVVGGTSSGLNQLQDAGHDLALIRLNPNGSFDNSFGIDGEVVTDLSYQEHLNGLDIQQDGKLVVAGKIPLGSAFSVVRYLPNGILDASFGVGGRASVTFTDDPLDVQESAHVVKVQPDGKTLAAGQAKGQFIVNEWVGDFGIARFTEQGQPDLSFGNGGKVSTDFGGRESVSALLLRPDGSFFASGATCAGNPCDYDFALARYTSAGELDPTFGAGGLVTADLGHHDYASDMALQDGRIVLGGKSGSNSPGAARFSLARYHLNGQIDRTFGTEGLVGTSVGSNGYAKAIAIQNQGAGQRIVAAGGSDGRFALVRYLPSLAEVSITNLDAPDPVSIGKELTYTLTLKNSGSDPAEDVKLVDPLSDKLADGAATVTPSQGTCTETDRLIGCDLGILAPNAMATVVIRVNAPAIPTLDLANTATVTSATFDPEPGNNTATALTRVIDPSLPAPDPTADPLKPPPVEPAPAPPTAGGAVSNPAGTSGPGGPPAAPPSGLGGTPGALTSTAPSSVSAPVSSAASAPIGGPAIQPQMTPAGVSSSVPGQVPALSAGSALSDVPQDEPKGAAVFNMVGHSDSKAPLFGFMLAGFMVSATFAYSARCRNGAARHTGERPAFAIARI